MQIAILSRGSQLYSTQSLLKAGEKRQHQIQIIDPTFCTPVIENGVPVMYKGDTPLTNIDAIIPRIGASNTYFGAAIVRHFEAMGVFSVVRADAILESRDKWSCFQILSKHRVAVPKTVLGNSPNIETQLKTFGSKPVIIKLIEGTHGTGVILAESFQNALTTIETLKAAKVKFVLQEFIEESKGADLRVIVVDGVVVAAMKRQSKSGDFRSNLHRGGSSQNIQLTDAEEQLALKAAKALRLGVCGIDILQAAQGPMVLEINSTPGLEGIETTTRKNISKSIIGYIERHKKR